MQARDVNWLQIDPDNVRKFTQAIIPQPSEIAPDFFTFEFTPRSVAYESTPLVSSKSFICVGDVDFTALEVWSAFIA